MPDLRELVIVCDKNRGSGVVTPVKEIEFPKGTCPCYGCTAAYYMKRVGRVKTAFGVYENLLNLVSATDDFETMSTFEIKKEIIKIAIPLLSIGKVHVNIAHELQQVVVAK